MYKGIDANKLQEGVEVNELYLGVEDRLKNWLRLITVKLIIKANWSKELMQINCTNVSLM